MKSWKRIFAWLLVACLLAGCSGGAGSATEAGSAESTGSAAVSTASAGDTAGSETSTVGAAGSTAEAQAAAEQIPPEEIPGYYKNANGWVTYYEPELVEIAEDTGDRVEFVYTGEQAGDNNLVVEYIPDKQPQEVLTEQIEEGGFDLEDVERDEGFAGADRWCFKASVDASDDGLMVTIDYTAIEFLDGVLLSTVTSSMETESTLEMLGSDAMVDIVNSMTFDGVEPQKMFSYYPGVYNKADETKEGPQSITLYDDHSGIMKEQEEEEEETDLDEAADEADTEEEADEADTDEAADEADTDEAADEADTDEAADEADTDEAADEADTDEAADEADTDETAAEADTDEAAEEEDDENELLPVIWTSNEILVKNEDTSWEFSIEGDNLYLNVEEDWVEYNRDTSATLESRLGPDSMTSSARAMVTPEEEVLEQPADPSEFKPVEKTPEEYQKEIEELYTKDGPGTIGRIHKMQAFLMELALHAKTKNPDFKVVIQGAEYIAFKDGNAKKGLQPSVLALIDGWGNEGMVGKSTEFPPNPIQKSYLNLIEAGEFVSDTTLVNTEEGLTNYISKAQDWGVVPFPRVGGELSQELYPGQRWASNFDYFWVEDIDKIGLSEYADGSRDVNELTDAKTYLYNINGRPYDNWNLWDQEEAAFSKGTGDKTRITDSFACGLLVPSENGSYLPTSEDPNDETIAEIIAEYGDHWDWWWREAGLDENSGREAWLDQLRNSDYDVIFIDSCYNHRAGPDSLTPLTKEEVESLKTKPDGGRRQVLSYLAIGTAEQNRWYCQDDWKWIDPDNLNSTYSMKTGEVRWLGNRAYYIPFESTEAGQEAEGDPIPTWLAFSFGDEYPEESVVQWWHKDWRDIIINGGGKYNNIVNGDNTSSIDRIIDQGFDGVYLDNPDSCTDDGWFAYEDYWAEHGGIPTE